jgi:serine/threonine-protein kinase
MVELPMPTPLAFLKSVGKALLDGAAGGGGDVLSAVAAAAWGHWTAARSPAARRPEIGALAQTGATEIRHAVTRVVADVASGQGAAVRQALATYLLQVPATIRNVLRDYGADATALGQLPLDHTDDLVPLLPAEVPAALAEIAPPPAPAPAAAGGGDGEPTGPPAEPPPAEHSGITLTVLEGPHQGQTIAFGSHDTFLVGRSRYAHFRLGAKDLYFSRMHFLVEVNPPRCRLADLHSRNGTFVNDQKVLTADLRDGDLIKAGKTVFRVGIDHPEPPAEAPSDSVSWTVPGSPPKPSVAVDVQPMIKSEPPQSFPQVDLTTTETTEPCRACGAPAIRPPEGSSELPLCGDCRRQSRELPQAVPGYLLVRELGKGGRGVVYQALRQADGAVVALKTIVPARSGSATEVERFLREADILRQLDHPHIVAFREMGEVAGRLYFVMDYVPGTDAARLLQRDGPLPVGRAVGLACQLLEALAYAHGKGFVHRDVKPSNLLVTEADGREVSRLADFGLARVYQASKLSGLTLLGDVGGTPAYMAPEQITHYRESKPPVDQYAAAATLYTLLTGRHVYDDQGSVQTRLLRILQDEPVPILQRRPDLPEALAGVVHRALARHVIERFPDVEAMRQALLPFGG